MLKNPCIVIIDPEKNPQKVLECQKIMENVVIQGMTVAFTRHFENMKQIESFYWYYKKHPDAEFIFPAPEAGGDDMLFVNMSSNNQENNIINILNLPISREVNEF